MISHPFICPVADVVTEFVRFEVAIRFLISPLSHISQLAQSQRYKMTKDRLSTGARDARFAVI